jgi:hypothetical protein
LRSVLRSIRVLRVLRVPTRAGARVTTSCSRAATDRRHGRKGKRGQRARDGQHLPLLGCSS